MITELMQLACRAGPRQELRTSTRAMLDGLLYPAFVTDAEGVTLYSNRQYQAYTGLSAEALTGNAWAALIHPEDREQAAATWMSALVLGAALEVEYRFRRADGADRWFRRTATPQLDEHGSIRYWFGTLTDIHDLKIAEAAALSVEARPRELNAWAHLAETPARAGIFEWDPITEELRWSARCKAAFGSPADEEPSDEVFQSRLHPEDRPLVLARIERALDPGGPGQYRSQHRVLWPDGTVRWMRAKGEVTFGDVAGLRRAVHFSGTVLDVTEAKQSESGLSDC